MEKTIKLTDLVQHILKHMTAEEALMKLLATQVSHYEKLKLEKQPEDNPETISPYFILVNAALDLGWDIMIEDEKKSTTIRGIAVGTREYLHDLVNLKKKDNETEGLVSSETQGD